MLKITLKKSVIGYNKKQAATAKALGLSKIGSSVLQPENDAILGMVHKISHLLDVEKVSDEEAK